MSHQDFSHRQNPPWISIFLLLCFIPARTPCASANPMSKPYIPFRTSPYEHDHLHHSINWENPIQQTSETRWYDPETAVPDDYCPLQFSLGVSHHLHHAASRPGALGIVEPPVIFPVLPALGPGRQVLYTTQYEHLDMLTPQRSNVMAGGSSSSVIKEGLIQHAEFPLLFESSSFLTSPIVADVNADGIADIILSDYDGGIYVVGTRASPSTGQRYFHKAQVPRLYVRRQWMESRVNETLGIKPTEEEEPKDENPVPMTDDIPMDRYGKQEKPHDPYHSYFEYSYGSNHEHETILRGVTANVLGQDHEHMQGLEERRSRKIQHIMDTTGSEPGGYFEDEQEVEVTEGGADANHRRLQEVIVDPIEQPLHRRLEEVVPETEGDQPETNEDQAGAETDDVYRDFSGDDVYMGYGDDRYDEYPQYGDDIIDGYPSEGLDMEEIADLEEDTDDSPPLYADDDYPQHDDGYGRYDDYYGRYSQEHEDYYDDKHYVRIPPHILCTPVAVELPKMYSQNAETETLLFVAVSYFLDEDEYDGFFSYKRFKDKDHGDETEVQRGMYLANAIMIYQFGDAPRWGRQEHLDLSGDHSAPINTTLVGSIPLQQDNTKMGAFALGSPTVADIDGDGSTDVLIGTSMGMLYVMDARNLYNREGWPIQLPRGIESRVLVEDVQGDTNLEIFVVDVGGNIVCLNHKGEKLWHRDLLSGIGQGSEITAASPMVLGDIDGNGSLDLVVSLTARDPSSGEAQYLFAVSAVTGSDLSKFPIRMGPRGAQSNDESKEFVVQKIPAPLLVDLHSDQAWVDSYLKRGGTSFSWRTNRKPDKAPHGGPNVGIHVVLPVGSNLVIVEGASGCTQTIAVGDKIQAMAQADDVHGTNGLDLVVTTASGNVITLESPAPFHPLNVWGNGEMRGRSNAFAHGYSSSQGIFVHDVSRQYRDIFGVYLPVTFEIFDNRPNIKDEPNRQVYIVEVRVGISKAIFRKSYNKVGVYTERMYIPHGAGYYQVTAVLKSTHGILYEDTFHLGYNVNYMDGFGLMLWLPLLLAFVCIMLCGTRKTHWDDDDYDGGEDSRRQGILGGPLPE